MDDDGASRVLARGRVSIVLDLGDGRVLRRNPDSDAIHEAALMRHLRAHGLDVPTVHEARGGDLVMERLEGPTMLEDLVRRPDRLAEHARTLAALHAALDEVPVPSGLERHGPGGRVLHLDLHPGNVVLTERGPVLLDWTNAGTGARELDLATTWLLLACHEVPAEVADVVEPARAALVEAFLGLVDVAAARRALPAAAELQLTVPSLGADVHERLRDLVRRETGINPGRRAPRE